MKKFLVVAASITTYAALLFASVANVVYTPSSVQHLIQSLGTPCVFGDTFVFTAWLSSGELIGTVNDGEWGASCLGGNIMILKADSLNPLSLSLVNQMTSWLGAGVQDCFDDVGTAKSCKSAAIWDQRGDGRIYLNAFAQGGAFQTYRSSIIYSDDKGVTWTNRAHQLAGSGGNQADGDMCTATTVGGNNCIQFVPSGGVDDPTSKMGKLAIITWGQGGATPPTIPGVDTSCTYFFSNRGGASNDNHNVYLHAVKTSEDPMDPTKWHHYAGSGGSGCSDPSTWDSNPDNSTELSPVAWRTISNYSTAGFYDGVTGLFYMLGTISGLQMRIAVSATPCGPYVEITQPTLSVNVGPGFSNPLPSTYAPLVNGRGFQISIMSNAGDGFPKNWLNSPGATTYVFQVPQVTSGAVVSQ